ncbi:multicopper oxidase-domain-containing protein [Aspergillus pseudoustus]|uniref:Multicopper oxidase-domain-containing protein n=1 Tax=Aspergillus pseudoustus TaxID=1810923 RepID=A0ABR4K3M6_9EURO
MQRLLGWRIKPRPADSSDTAFEDLPSRRHSQKRGKAIWLVLYSVLLCTSTGLLYWNRSIISHQPSLPQLYRGDVEENVFQSPNADAVRPRIELHPEEYVDRAQITHYLDWTVAAGYLRPDGVLKRVYTINGMFPGPTIEARSGDTIIINVTNTLHDEAFSLHWHGLHIKNSVDGAAGVTQSPISPGFSFIYEISIPADQSGTFWYHAHAGLVRADGLYGGLVVHEPAAKVTVRSGIMSSSSSSSRSQSTPSDNKETLAYTEDLLLLVGDWYHRPAWEVMAWYMRAGSFGNEPVPDSLLINGVGHFNCSKAVPARPLDCVNDGTPVTLSGLLSTDSVYRVRFVNTGSLAGFRLSMENHDCTVLEVDGVPVELQDSANSVGVLYPGQRIDLLVRRTSSDKPSFLKIDLDEESFKYPNPALTTSQEFLIFHPKSQSQVQPANNKPTMVANTFIDIQNLPSTSQITSRIPQTAAVQRTEVVYTKIEKLAINNNVPYGVFNRTSWTPQMSPPIPLIDLDPEQWQETQFGITVPKPFSPGENNNNTPNGYEGVWVDIVVNNLDEGGHPFHLHGHHFYILSVHKASIGWGSYNPFADPSLDPGKNFPDTKTKYNLSRAMLRDTVYIPSRGHAVLRFRADNPGIWMFHCHVLWHFASGMAMLVNVE